MSELVATDSPLSFCMVTTFFPPYHFGGEAMYIHRVSNELAKRGHQVTVIHCVDSFRTLAKAPPRGEFALHENVTVHRLKSRLGPISPLVTYLSGRPVKGARAGFRLPNTGRAISSGTRYSMRPVATSESKNPSGGASDADCSGSTSANCSGVR